MSEHPTPGANIYITHCIHGIDLRLFPRCYLCRPVAAHTLDLASPEAVGELARALAQAEVGCWANPPIHGPEQDDEAHARDAIAVLAALRKGRETLGS